MPKEKLKALYGPYMATNNSQDSNRYEPDDSVYSAYGHSKSAASSISQSQVPFERIIVPYYLPNFDLDNQLKQVQARLASEATNAANIALSVGLKNTPPAHLAKISQKYEFPWGLVTGLFEKFTTSCLLKSELNKKLHYKNLLQAYNEDNTLW